MLKFSTYNDDPEFVAKFMEILILDEGIIHDLITAGEFSATGHPVLDCANGGDCECCYSGDTSFEVHDLPNKLSEIWEKTRRYFKTQGKEGSSSAEDDSFEDDED